MKKGLFKKIFASALVGAMSLSLVACGGDEEKKDMLQEIKDKGTLVVGLSPDYAPYEFIVMEDGKEKIVGFDTRIAEEIAKDLGVKLEYKSMEFNSLVGALPAGQIDLVISGMNPDEERRKSIDFSEIYYMSEHGILVRAEDKDKYKSIEDLKDAKIGCQLGSTQQKIVEDTIKPNDKKLLADVNALILELKTGKIDVLVTEKPVAEMAVKTNPELFVGDVSFKDDGGGNAVGIKKDNPELVKAINDTIKRLKESGDIDKFIVEACDLAGKNAK